MEVDDCELSEFWDDLMYFVMWLRVELFVILLVCKCLELMFLVEFVKEWFLIIWLGVCVDRSLVVGDDVLLFWVNWLFIVDKFGGFEINSYMLSVFYYFFCFMCSFCVFYKIWILKFCLIY